MEAAVVSSFDHPPRYETIGDPAPAGAEAVLVDVMATGLHPRVRSGANGSHYTSTARLPFVPGIDGVGRTVDGELVYFVAEGSMAERVVVDPGRFVMLPATADTLSVAAGMNPGMSAWVALRRRITFEQGQNVFVLGATGNAGQLAVQIAKHFGAGTVVAAGRDGERLDALHDLGADAVVSIADDADGVSDRLATATREVDVVIDYLWGEPAERAMHALLRGRAERSRAVAWIQIGAVAGPTISLPSEALRSANLQILGSGQGSVTTAGIAAVLPELATAISDGRLQVNAMATPLTDIEHTWEIPVATGHRRVFTL